jgi:hypothetical protein
MPKRNSNVQAQQAHWAAPIGGWNSLNALAAMDPTDAVRMDNLFPETSFIRLRRGSQTWYTVSSTTPVRSLMTYSAIGGDHLLAATGNTLYDITAKASTVVLATTGSDTWEYVNFATPGGQYWVGVNGTGQQWTWNGTGTAVAGVNTHDASISAIGVFSSICAFQSRLFFCTITDLILYYLPVNVFQGEVHGLDLGSLLTLGGQIAYIGTWTRDDSTLGMNDLLVIGTTKGEILTYRGVNPDDPSNWFLAGRFVVGKPPAGHRQLVRLGPDMMLICEDGFQSLSNYIAMGQSKALTTAISHKIGNAVTQAILANSAAPGWCAILHPPKNVLIVNVPIAGGGFEQYVVNTITGAWCRFTGLNAWCWTSFAGGLYFGANNGAVIQADINGDDNGKPINFDLITAFQTFGGVLQQKRALMCRPIMIASGKWYPVMDVNTDYAVTPVTSVLNVSSDETTWNNFNWDQADWGSTGTPQSEWYSVNGIGMSFAVRLSGTAVDATLQLMALDMAYEQAIGFV